MSLREKLKRRGHTLERRVSVALADASTGIVGPGGPQFERHMPDVAGDALCECGHVRRMHVNTGADYPALCAYRRLGPVSDDDEFPMPCMCVDFVAAEIDAGTDDEFWA